MRKLIVIPWLALLLPTLSPAAANADEAPSWSLTLRQAVEMTLRNSPQLKSAELAAAAGEAHARAALGPRLPRLSVDGSYRYLTTLPQLALPPALDQVAFLTHNAYGVGPTLSMPLFDGGVLYNGWRAALAAARAQSSQAEALRRQLRLAARLTYFQAVLAAEQVRLTVQSFEVEEAEERDIELRTRAGTASSVDLLSARQLLLARQDDVIKARGDLGEAVRELSALTLREVKAPTTWPLDGRTSTPLPEAMDPPTLIVSLDPVSDVVGQMESFDGYPFNPGDPRLAQLAEVAEAAKLTVKSLQGENWPKLTVLAASAYQYPLTPLRENVVQNTFGVSLSFPLFTGGETASRVKEEKLLAQASDKQLEQTELDLDRDWRSARDQIPALLAREGVDRRSADAADDLARLQFAEYRAGHSRYLDVEEANLRRLQADMLVVQTQVQRLVQLANLESLGLNSKEQQ